MQHFPPSFVHESAVHNPGVGNDPRIPGPELERLLVWENFRGETALDLACAMHDRQLVWLLLFSVAGVPQITLYDLAWQQATLRKRFAAMVAAAGASIAALLRGVLRDYNFSTAMGSLATCSTPEKLAALWQDAEEWEWMPAPGRPAAWSGQELVDLHFAFREAAGRRDEGLVDWLLDAWGAPLRPPAGFERTPRGRAHAGVLVADCAAVGGDLANFLDTADVGACLQEGPLVQCSLLCDWDGRGDPAGAEEAPPPPARRRSA